MQDHCWWSQNMKLPAEVQSCYGRQSRLGYYGIQTVLQKRCQCMWNMRGKKGKMAEPRGWEYTGLFFTDLGMQDRNLAGSSVNQKGGRVLSHRQQVVTAAPAAPTLQDRDRMIWAFLRHSCSIPHTGHDPSSLSSWLLICLVSHVTNAQTPDLPHWLLQIRKKKKKKAVFCEQGNYKFWQPLWKFSTYMSGGIWT